MIINKNKTKVVATICVKNEADIIAKNIEHHINQGIDNFIITDNGSTDATTAIISRFPEVKEIIDESGCDFNQSVWVSRMAHLACKFKPDWVIHLDADELWCGVNNLNKMKKERVACTSMFLHPPINEQFTLKNMCHYLDFEHIKELPGECKVAHRPDPHITITHGNHGFGDNKDVEYTNLIWRHHYPVRSLEQFRRKALGHKSLERRNAICERWKKWYELDSRNELENLYNQVCHAWIDMIKNPNKKDLQIMLEFWSTPEVIDFFEKTTQMPRIGKWPSIAR